jgi:transcriptional antiterminator RfaH
MLKLSENPPIRLERDESVTAVAGDWWVGHTKARQEKVFAKELAVRGVSYFLPLVPKVSFSGGRRRKALMPLFTSYVFFCGDTEDRVKALDTNRLTMTIEVKYQRPFVEQLRALERVIEADVPVDSNPWTTVGRRVRVKAGPLEGVVGTVINRDDVTQLVIEIEVMGQAAAVRVEPDLLEPYEE